jgi:hypothetical protein
MLVVFLALGTLVAFAPFTTSDTTGLLVRLPRTDLEIPMIARTRATPERMVGVGESTVHAEATR